MALAGPQADQGKRHHPHQLGCECGLLVFFFCALVPLPFGSPHHQGSLLHFNLQAASLPDARLATTFLHSHCTNSSFEYLQRALSPKTNNACAAAYPPVLAPGERFRELLSFRFRQYGLPFISSVGFLPPGMSVRS